MPIVSIQRVVSSTTTTVTAIDRATAVSNLLAGTPPNVVNVGNSGPWPEIVKYTNDNNTAFAGTPDPQIIWSQASPLSGESRGFAAQSVVIPLSVGIINNFLISLAVFADNAHLSRIQVVNDVGVFLVPQPTGLDVDLLDGPMNVFTMEPPPFSWQRVRYYTIPVSLGLISVPTSVRLIFSFTVANYIQPDAGNNPAGLAFIADIYSDFSITP
ncbi:hypothetical protein [Paenibacillus prosopidis]|uniref:Uncharacterized protein n=1 Tax=Paenibacillus prosopidis TaxID=630520 RepID=A0A368W8Y3_9BACL|nr:hypothetical protein [Paenibacillus prosopidis]RCW50891.1 hypothetical protein DFP97_10283 [Paenibacillus prosopidis]